MTYGHSAGIESRNSDLDGEPGEGTGSDQSLRAGFWARGGGGDVQVVRAFVQSLDGEAFLPGSVPARTVFGNLQKLPIGDSSDPSPSRLRVPRDPDRLRQRTTQFRLAFPTPHTRPG